MRLTAGYAPTATIASAFTPLILGTLLSFAGVFVPYSAIPEFWRYWLTYLDVFTYIMGSILWFVLWDKPVNCRPGELTDFDPPQGQTCGAYLDQFLTQYNPGANLLNPDSTSGCQVCAYTSGTDYLRTINIAERTTGWRDIGITGIFVVSSYAIVFLMMKLRTKATKKAD
jgi:ATP-binding cassette subfamily G (WHITE) protein 2 (SNQ2)